MTFYRDMGCRTMVASGRYVRAVGWLCREQLFSQGPVAAEAFDRLHQFATRWRDSTQALGWGKFRGLHRCEFCGSVQMFGNFGVPAAEVLYVAPEKVAHYVEAHGYTPPAGFLTAVVTAPLPGTEAYTTAVARFRRLHLRARAQRLWRLRRHRRKKGIGSSA
jgi:hypothetical protein